MSSPPTVVIGDSDHYNNPYRHQGAYAIRKPGQQPSNNTGNYIPQSPVYSTAPPGALIPENIKKSYERQQLPVRSQSLAAATTVATVVTSLYDRHRNDQIPGQLSSRHRSNGSEGSSRSEASCSTPSTPPPNFTSLAASPPSPIKFQTTTSRSKLKPGVAAEGLSIATPPYESFDEEEEEEDEDDYGEDEFDDVSYDIDDDINLLAFRSHDTTSDPIAAFLDVKAQPIDGLSPMAYETENQQNTFFSHYAEAADSGNNKEENHPADIALLSYIAREMYLQILPEAVRQDGVEYHYLFTGKEAVVSQFFKSQYEPD